MRTLLRESQSDAFVGSVSFPVWASRPNSVQIRNDGGKIATEALFDARLLDALLFASINPNAVQVRDGFTEAGTDDTSLTDKLANRARKFVEIID